MYCNNCGKEIDDKAVVCPNCGVATPNMQQNQVPEDNGGFGWGLLGCCIPIVGLILYLVWKNEKPRTAKALGIGALVSVICGILYYIIIIALGVSMAGIYH